MESRKPLDKGTVIGLVLVGLGALFLLNTMGIFDFMWDFTIGLAFLGGGAIFLAVFANDRRQWWALFPSFGLGFIGLMILLDRLLPGFDDIGGSLFLGGLGAAFLAVYANKRSEVWPLIPGGVLMTLAVVAGLDQIFPRFDGGTVFFLGLGLTFSTVYALAPNRSKHGWALIVAAIMFGIAFLTVVGTLFKFAFPLILIGLGVFMLRDRLFTTTNR